MDEIIFRDDELVGARTGGRNARLVAVKTPSMRNNVVSETDDPQHFIVVAVAATKSNEILQ